MFYFSNLSTLDSTNSRHSSQICPWKIHPWKGLTRFPPRPPRRGACCSIRSAAEAGGEAGRMVRHTSYVSSGKGRRLCCLRTAFFCSCSSRSPPSDVWQKRKVQHHNYCRNLQETERAYMEFPSHLDAILKWTDIPTACLETSGWNKMSSIRTIKETSRRPTESIWAFPAT